MARLEYAVFLCGLMALLHVTSAVKGADCSGSACSGPFEYCSSSTCACYAISPDEDNDNTCSDKTCSLNSDCEGLDVNSYCGGTGTKTCMCKETYAIASDTTTGKCATIACAAQEDCTGNTYCDMSNADDKKCACVATMPLQDGVCADKVCTADGDCSTNGYCNMDDANNKMCKCKTLSPLTDGVCTDKACTADTDCTSLDTNSMCNTDDNVCKCKSTHKEAANGNCEPKVLSDTCAASSDCVAVDNSFCSNTQCACKPLYTEAQGACGAKSCTTNTDCGIDNAVCTGAEGSKTCGCNTTFYENGEGQCMARILGSACTDNTHCGGVEKAECKNNVCACMSGYENKSGMCEESNAGMIVVVSPVMLLVCGLLSILL